MSYTIYTRTTQVVVSERGLAVCLSPVSELFMLCYVQALWSDLSPMLALLTWGILVLSSADPLGVDTLSHTVSKEHFPYCPFTQKVFKKCEAGRLMVEGMDFPKSYFCLKAQTSITCFPEGQALFVHV